MHATVGSGSSDELEGVGVGVGSSFLSSGSRLVVNFTPSSPIVKVGNPGGGGFGNSSSGGFGGGSGSSGGGGYGFGNTGGSGSSRFFGNKS